MPRKRAKKMQTSQIKISGEGRGRKEFFQKDKLESNIHVKIQYSKSRLAKVIKLEKYKGRI